MKIELLRMDNITKVFSGIEVLNNVNINVYKGEVLAVIGENGAGKTTLIKILSGIFPKSSGTIYLNEREIEISSPLDSQKKGIVCIHQELNLVPDFSIADNILMANGFNYKTLFIGGKSAYHNAKRLLAEVGLNIDPNRKAKSLTMGQKYLVEVAKALSINAQLIVMDETTASLTDMETGILKNIINKLKKQGVSIIFISHKLDEVIDIADRVTVLREGSTVATVPKADCTIDKLIKLMMGKELMDFLPSLSANIGEELLRVEHITSGSKIKNVSFNIRKGEVLGITGLVGSGRSELAKIIFGISPKDFGEIYLHNQRIEIKSPGDAIRNGLGLIPEDKMEQGLTPNMTVRENIVLSILKKISTLGWINSKVQKFVVKESIKELGMRFEDEYKQVFQLSGGNQQKVLISKFLAANPQVLIMDEPTKGLDIVSKKQIYDLIYKLSQQGVAIITIMSDLREVVRLSDRILVMKEGRIMGELSREEADQGKIMQLSIT